MPTMHVDIKSQIGSASGLNMKKDQYSLSHST